MAPTFKKRYMYLHVALNALQRFKPFPTATMELVLDVYCQISSYTNE